MTASRPTSARAPGIAVVASAWLPLGFIGAGLAALALAALALVTQPQLLLLPHVHPHVVALAHLWLPGFLLSVSLGAIYQLMPVVLGAPLRLPLSAAWTHLGLHAAGVTLLVGGFAFRRFDVVAIGGTAATLGALVLLVGTWRTFLASNRRDAIGWSFPLAVSWLAAAMVFGIVLAVNRHAAFLPLPVVDLLRAHAHVGLGGLFLTLLQGATFQLVPMFTMADLRKPACVRAGLALSQAGLLVVTPGLACARLAVTLAGVVLLVAGIGVSGAALIATFRSRRRRVLEPGLKAFAVGAALAAIAAFAGVALALRPGIAGGAGVGAMAYGATIIVGALSFMVLGMLCKIVPFLVWMKVYGLRAGRQPVPLASALGSPVLKKAWLVVHGVALVLVIAAIATASRALADVSAVVLAGAVGLFLANVSRVAAHLFRPQATRPAATASVPGGGGLSANSPL